MNGTLGGHAQQLDEARAEFLRVSAAVGLELSPVTPTAAMGEVTRACSISKSLSCGGRCRPSWLPTARTRGANGKNDCPVRAGCTGVGTKTVALDFGLTAQLLEIQRRARSCRGSPSRRRAGAAAKALAHNLSRFAPRSVEESIPQFECGRAYVDDPRQKPTPP